ncbi:MAG: Lpg1974 family pore-forming outer membrane protein [Candidatus Berkiella sp.]
MKKALQVTFGAVMAIGIVGAVSANDATIGRTALLLTGTYTKTAGDGLSYGDVLLAPSGIGGDGFQRHVFVDPDWEFDFGVGLTHRFCGSNTRFFAYWDHFRADDDAATSGVRNLGFAPPPITNGKMEVEQKSDELRIGLSRGMHFGHYFTLDLGGFFEWDKVERNTNEYISQAGSPDRFRSTENEMQGFGPGVAVMARAFPSSDYRSFSVFMGAMTSLLYANNEFDQSNFRGEDLFYHYQPDDSKSVVGKLDISFGIDYCNRVHTDSTGMTVGISLGMRYMNIFNAFKNGNTAYNTAGDVANNNFAPYTGGSNDFGRIGPFLQVRVGGANA